MTSDEARVIGAVVSALREHGAAMAKLHEALGRMLMSADAILTRAESIVAAAAAAPEPPRV